ncbi:hypothetical protein ACFOEQ_23235 [Chryseobacterium arachidis]
MKQGKVPASTAIKAEMDSIINEVNNHYTREIKKIQVKIIKSGSKSK